jgi:hypothetical protein
VVALDLDRVEFVILDHEVRRRLPIFWLIWRNATRSPEDDAVQSPIGQETRANIEPSEAVDRSSPHHDGAS